MAPMFWTRIHEFSVPNVYDASEPVATALVASWRRPPPDATTASESTAAARSGHRMKISVWRNRLGNARIIGSFRHPPAAFYPTAWSEVGKSESRKSEVRGERWPYEARIREREGG